MRRFCATLAAVGALTCAANAWAVELYNNGPLATGATLTGGGIAPAGTQWSELQTSLGLNTLGFGHAVSSGFRVADDFTVPAPGWTIDSIRVFAYQTGGSSTTTTFNNVNFRIWDGVPNAAGSNIVFGDTTTNRLTGSSFSSLYRASSTAPGTTRPIWNLDASAGVDLGPGTYWIDWQAGGTLASGPWAAPVTILGLNAKPGSNGLQYDPTALLWNPANDSGTGTPRQDLPFVINGSLIPEPASFGLLTLSGIALIRRRK
jgi:hypothetical protein